jgi:hypothetical protein
MPNHNVNTHPEYVAPYPPLKLESRSHVDTACAAYHLSLAEQTLRKYACYEAGPIIPSRLNRRLRWSVSAIRALLEGGAK